jgi:hypothetical protein
VRLGFGSEGMDRAMAYESIVISVTEFTIYRLGRQ